MNNLEALNIVINAINAAHSRGVYTAPETAMISNAINGLATMVNNIQQAQAAYEAQQKAANPGAAQQPADGAPQSTPFVSQVSLQKRNVDEPQAQEKA